MAGVTPPVPPVLRGWAPVAVDRASQEPCVPWWALDVPAAACVALSVGVGAAPRPASVAGREPPPPIDLD